MLYFVFVASKSHTTFIVFQYQMQSSNRWKFQRLLELGTESSTPRISLPMLLAADGLWELALKSRSRSCRNLIQIHQGADSQHCVRAFKDAFRDVKTVFKDVKWAMSKTKAFLCDFLMKSCVVMCLSANEDLVMPLRNRSCRSSDNPHIGSRWNQFNVDASVAVNCVADHGHFQPIAFGASAAEKDDSSIFGSLMRKCWHAVCTCHTHVQYIIYVHFSSKAWLQVNRLHVRTPWLKNPSEG